MSDCFFKDRTIKAAKPHRCSSCGLWIEIGELYLYQTNVYDREFQSRRVHRFCWDIWKRSIEFDELGDFQDVLDSWLEYHLDQDDLKKMRML